MKHQADEYFCSDKTTTSDEHQEGFSTVYMHQTPGPRWVTPVKSTTDVFVQHVYYKVVVEVSICESITQLRQ
jgi:hypothetical protein